MVSAASAPPWPALREELRLYPGAPGQRGEPTWTLHDPPAQKFYRLGWLEVEILNRWRLGSPGAIARAVERETTLRPNEAMVEALKNFFVANSLVASPAPADVQRLVQRRYGKKQSLLMMGVKNYLFIRLPLFKPDRFLTETLGRVRWFFKPACAVVLGVLALLGFYLISRQWENFRDSFAALLTLRGGVMTAAAMALGKAVHELGHAYAAKSLGLRVPTMGVSLMCFAPVLWTDTTEAWKLPSRRERLFIGASGVYAELTLAVLAALAWPLLPPGGMKTAAFMIAGSAWILTLTVNANPCMRYDGYYLLSDYWNLPGLQTRSFALAKWRMREWLFDLGLPPPEIFSRWDGLKLVVYAYITWVYRFFLFLGIALLVYHLFFKALGTVLMTVELVFFIAMPAWMEIMAWIKLRKHFRFTYRLVRTVVLFAALVLFFVYPWHHRVEAAALLFAEKQANLFAAQGAVVEEASVANGERVEAGQVLFRLRSPDLEARIAIAAKKLTSQRDKLSVASLDSGIRAEMAAEWEELERLAEDLGGMLAQRDELEVRAAFAGVLNDKPEWITEGTWVAAKEPLGTVTAGGSQVAAYVSEADWNRVSAGGGRFYPNGAGWRTLPLTIERVEAQAVTEIGYPELGSTHGGPLAVYKDASGRLVPEHAVYRVLCKVDDPDFGGRFLAGNVNLEATPRSLVDMIWNNFLGLLIRESGYE